MWNSLKDFIGVPKEEPEPVPRAALQAQRVRQTEASVQRLKDERAKLTREEQQHREAAKKATAERDETEAKYQLRMALSAKKGIIQLNHGLEKLAKVRAGTQSYDVSNVLAEALEGVGEIAGDLHDNADRLAAANEGLADLEAGVEAVNDALAEGNDEDAEIERMYEAMRADTVGETMSEFPDTPSRPPAARVPLAGGFVVTKKKEKERE